MKFVFERNLPHQTRAVEAIVEVFKDLNIRDEKSYLKDYVNPIIDINSLTYLKNIENLMYKNEIKLKPIKSNIVDIMMETGTGKTYTYTKAMFELNRFYGINKFVVVVPSLSIKAGAINFILSESAREHFKDEYQKSINLYVVDSKKNKNKKEYMPTSIKSFVEARKSKNSIEVLLINQGMLNSDTLSKNYDRTLFDRFTNPFDAIASINPVVIIDEPHRFKKDNKTWKNIQKLNPQFILRFGATFDEDKKGNKKFENLIYTLTAAKAFNNNLVKGVIGYIEKNESGKNALVELINLDGKEATFVLKEGKKKSFKLGVKDSLGIIHPAIDGLFIEKMNKSEVLLSNGMILRKKDKFNPYSFSETIQEVMIRKAIKNHFKIEKELIENRNLEGKPKIKPLTLFFIDNIDEYRNEDGKLRKIVEENIKICIEENFENTKDEFYKRYLEKSLKDISKTHGGYFSKDNQAKDEEIEKEINEILHDKDKLLDLENPRRFIFSKWTLKEGWDNPNVFQICKLRSSGSEISKLQEVGRGLRLPVNEFGVRVKDEFFLHYFVDFSEEDFVDRLINEINEKSNLFNLEKLDKLTDELIESIVKLYKEDRKKLVARLILDDIIDDNKKFINNGLEKLKEMYPLVFEKEGVYENKIKKADEEVKSKVKVRVGKYDELKEVWERINQKALMEIKVDSEEEFEELFYSFFKNRDDFVENRVYFEAKKVVVNDDVYVENKRIEEEFSAIKNLSYKEFVLEVSKLCKINVNTAHKVFLRLKKDKILDISKYLNYQTIRKIKYYFDEYLLLNSFKKFEIDYKLIKSSIHPTKLTDKNGNPLKEINASDIGVNYSDERVADNYYFEKLFYDSELEKENIKYNDDVIEVFTKIPKNSIKIPIIGGKSYSPDFAYVLKRGDEIRKVCFVIETKDKDEKDLTLEEKIKIKMAEKFFNEKVKIIFRKQLRKDKIEKIINSVLKV